MRKFKLQVSIKKTKRMAAVAVAASSKLESQGLKVRNAELDSKVTRIYSKVDVFKQLRAAVTRLGRDAEKMAPSLTDTASIHGGDVERADSLDARLAASVCRDDSYKLDLSPVKEDLGKTRVERSNLQWSAIDSIARVRKASADHGRALQAVVEIPNCSCEDVADNVQGEVGQAQ